MHHPPNKLDNLVDRRRQIIPSLVQRTVTGFIFASSFIAALIAGGVWFWGYATGVLALVGWEYTRLVRLPPLMTGSFLSFLVAIFYLISIGKLLEAWMVFQAAVIFQALIALWIWPRIPFERLSKSVFGLLYFSLPMAWFVDIVRYSLWHLIGFFALLWASDIGAYLVGRLFGRHPLAPQTSPGKTVEGFIGRLIFPLMITPLLMQSLDWGWATVIAGVGVGLAAEVGDLLESIWKRERGVKDSSSLLPGHGGFLDRLDSLFTALPLFWILWRYLLS